jgi:hypothetical protein
MQPRRKMTSVDATYDRKIVLPDEPLPLPPNARVVVSFEATGEEQPGKKPEKTGEPYSVLKAALAANLDGPPDWSERVDHYLYGTDEPPSRGKKSFIDTALSLSGEGPSDWSQRVDHYLYGDLVDDDDEG